MSENELNIDLESKPVNVIAIRSITAGNILKKAATFTAITSQADETSAAAIRNTLNALIKAVEKKRLELTNENYEHPKRAMIAAVNEKLEPFKKAEQELRTLILAYRDEERKKAEAAEAARRKAEEEAAAKAQAEEERRKKISLAKGGTGEVAPVEPEKVNLPAVENKLETSTVKSRMIWTYDRDSIDITKLPEEYKTADIAKITKAVQGGLHKIPGVNIYQKESI